MASLGHVGWRASLLFSFRVASPTRRAGAHQGGLSVKWALSLLPLTTRSTAADELALSALQPRSIRTTPPVKKKKKSNGPRSASPPSVSAAPGHLGPGPWSAHDAAASAEARVPIRSRAAEGADTISAFTGGKKERKRKHMERDGVLAGCPDSAGLMHGAGSHSASGCAVANARFPALLRGMCALANCFLPTPSRVRASAERRRRRTVNGSVVPPGAPAGPRRHKPNAEIT